MSNTKEVNVLTSAFVNSFDTFIKANSSTGTLTVEAQVKEIVDEGIGIYKVQYLENIFEATAASKDVLYNIDDIVYLLIPNGDFGKTKIILAPVNNNKSTFASTLDENIYIPLGDNLFSTIPNELSLYSYRNINPTDIEDLDLRDFGTYLKPALLDSRTFALQCDIHTEILEEQRKRGNYGLIFTIPTLQENVETEYVATLDINNLLGDPYNYQVYSRQRIYFTIPEGMKIDLNRDPSLQYFVQDFVLQNNTNPPDIFIKNINLISCLELSQDNMSGYHVQIIASGGNSFYNNYLSQNKTLTANVFLNGKSTDIKNFDCYWFRENASIGTSHEKYHRLGGIGWEILNDKTNTTTEAGGNESFRYITNQYSYEIKGSLFLTDTVYKCVLVKNAETYEGQITIRVVDSPVELFLFTERDNNTYIENIGQAAITMRCIDHRKTNIENIIILYTWKRYDRFGNYIKDEVFETPMAPEKVGTTEEGYEIYEGTIYLNVSDINISNKISCSIINIYSYENTNEEQLIGTRSIIIKTESSASYSINVTNGDKIYKYDSDGDSPMVANYDGPLSSAIDSIPPISFKLFKLNGEEFTSSEYAVTNVEWLIPQNSMINILNSLKTDSESNPGYWTISGSYNSLKQMSYSIANVYSKNRKDNTIIIKTYFKNDKADTIANIRFLKDGESGTNGTKYSAVVMYNGTAYGEKDINGIENKLQLYFANDTQKWYSYNPAVGLFKAITPLTTIVATMEAKLYADGEEVSNPEVEWEIFETEYRYTNISSPIKIDSEGRIYVLDRCEWNDPSYTFFAIIRAKLCAKKDNTTESLTNSEEYVYADYPIETIYVNKFNYLRSLIPNIKGGYSQVVFDSDGTGPQYDSSNPFSIENNLHQTDIGFLYDYVWAGSKNLDAQVNKDDSSKCKVIPTSKYDNGIAKNYLRTAVIPNDGAYVNRLTKIDLLNRDIQEKETQLSYYLRLQEAQSIYDEFNYNSYVNTINELQSMFSLKTDLTRSCQQMYNNLNEFKNFLYTSKGEDTVLNNYYDIVVNMINSVQELWNKCGELGIETEALAYVQNAAPENYTLNNISNPNKITLYITINNMIDSYNLIVTTVYKYYYDNIDNDFTNKVALLLGFINNTLLPFVNDDRWEVLRSSYLSY